MSTPDDLSKPSRIAYIWSEELQCVADLLPSNLGRSTVVHDLIKSLDLLDIDKEESSHLLGNGRPRQKADHAIMLERARVVQPNMEFGSREQLERYHDKAYVDYLMSSGNSTDSSEEETSDDSDGSDGSNGSNGSSLRESRGIARKRRKIEHGLEHDCPKFTELPRYALLVASATLTACQQLLDSSADIAICWDGGRHHTLRNRASGFCYVADVVLGIMHLTKFGRPRVKVPVNTASSSTALDGGPDHGSDSHENMDTTGQAKVDGSTNDPIPANGPNSTHGILNGTEPKPSTRPARKPRIMYLDLDIHEGDGVHQAFLSPIHFPTSLSSCKRPPRLPQVLTLSVHYHSRTFFPPHRPFSGLPSPSTPHPFTLSIPLNAYPSPSTYLQIWNSIHEIKEAFDPDYVVLQLGVDGLPGDRVGQYGAWSIHGDGGVGWCVQQVKQWGLPLVVLGGGGYDNPNSARAWATATSILLDRTLDEDTQIPHHEHFPLYSPSFTLGVPPSHATDENTSEHLNIIKDNFAAIAERIRSLVSVANQ